MADEFISLVISIGLFASIFVLIIVAGKRLRQAPFMLGSLASAFVLAFCFLWAAYYRTMTGEEQLVLENISLIPLIFVFFFFYLYFEALTTVKPPLTRVITMSGSLIFIVTLDISNILNLFAVPKLFPLFAGFTYFYGMLACGFGVSVFRKALATYRKTAIKIDLGVFSATLASTVILQVSGFSQFIFVSAFDWIMQLFWIGILVFMGAIGLLVINSVINGDYIYYIPHPIQAIMLYNDGGVLVYERTFESGDQRLLKGPELISSALTAFSSFFKEILGTEAKFSYIHAKNYEFHFADLPENVGTLVLVASSANLILLKSVKKLVHSLPNSLVESIKDFKGKMLLEEFDKLIKVYFPYLNPVIQQRT